MNNETDEQLIEQCRGGSQAAYEVIVKRYQVLVCSIAYSIVGNVASSEDVAQDAFLVAWKKLSDLRDPKLFKSWISTIARNESQAWRRHRANSVHELEEPDRIPAAAVKEEIVDQEEAELVWMTLSQLPESYREPLVLYYRHDRSVSEVADALSLSLSAAKQRLARGREMLRTEVLTTIERRLRKTVPTAAFTVGVMAVVSGSSNTAAAATGAAAAKMATTAAKSAAGGAVAGTLTGLLGGFAGAFASWYNAEYQSQRTLIVRQSLVYLVAMAIFTMPFVAMQFGWNPVVALGARTWRAVYALWMLVFLGLNTIWMIWCIRSYKRLQQKEHDAKAERLPRYKQAQEAGYKLTGRRWTSSRSLFGLPLVQVAFPDFQVGVEAATIAHQGTARAWIAIGHFAYGRIIGIGHRAIAPIALGTQAMGIASFGVFSIGIVSTGVLSLGAFAVGVVCIGGVGIGAAIAAGFFAVAPLAFALKAAKGAMVFSLQFAEGPLAFAPHANDQAASHFIASSSLIQKLDQVLLSTAAATKGTNFSYWVAGLIVLLVFAQRFVFQRRVE
ncbi:RNA polymerase sigma factor [Planctomycetota bacterium]